MGGGMGGGMGGAGQYRHRAVFRRSAVHPELAAEQEYLDRAHDHLGAMQATASRLAHAFAVTARTDMNDAAVQHSMLRYRAALDVGARRLCFGRIDEAGGD